MRRIAAIILALTLAGAAQGQEAVVLTPDELRAAAVAAFQGGAFGPAEQFARALLQRDPDDPVALAVLAQIALLAGDPAAARAGAAAIWRTADDPLRRYEAARIAAFAAMESGNLTAAQLWLRRAMTVAPDAEAMRLTATDFRAVRDANPLTLDFGLSVSPSDNVTGGSTVDVIRANGEIVCLEFGGACLPLSPSPIDRAYAGWSWAPRVQVSYRLREDAAGMTRAWASAQWRGVILSDEARAELEGEDYDGEQITDRHFSSGQAMAGIDHQINVANGNVTLSAQIGRTFARGDPNEDLVSLGVTRLLALDERRALIFGLTGEWRGEVEAGGDDQWRHVLRFGHIAILDNDMRLRFDLGLTDARSADYSRDFDRVSASLTVTPRDPLPGIGVEGRLSATWTNFPDYRFTDPIPGGRTDLDLALGVDVTLDRWSWAGFSPVVSVEAQRTTSNVNQFETGGLSVNFGLQSTF